jgi:actin-related protein
METEGISEVFESMFNRFGRPTNEPETNFEELQQSENLRARLLSYVLLTGGNTLVKGFDQRIASELRMLNPVGTTINVVRSLDAKLDAWRGGAMMASNFFTKSQIKDYTFSREQYLECGHHYLKEHFCSNYMYGPGVKPKLFKY